MAEAVVTLEGDGGVVGDVGGGSWVWRHGGDGRRRGSRGGWGLTEEGGERRKGDEGRRGRSEAEVERSEVMRPHVRKRLNARWHAGTRIWFASGSPRGFFASIRLIAVSTINLHRAVRTIRATPSQK